MANRRNTPNQRSQTASADRPSVVLKSGDQETTVHTTTAFNNLVFGHGYSPKSGSVEEAYAALLKETSAAADQPVPMTPPE